MSLITTVIRTKCEHACRFTKLTHRLVSTLFFLQLHSPGFGKQEITKRASLFKDGHCEDDVKQGELGNCWFVASVACFAYHEGLVDKVFHLS